MSLNTVDPTTGQTTKVAGIFDTTPIKEITEQLTANNTPFRFGYDETTGKYGYIINEGGADTVVPFKDCDSSEITVSAANQILSGYKDYDANGNLITGTNAGYDAGVTQGHSDRDSGVTVTKASQVLSGYKARTSSGTLVTGTATTGGKVTSEQTKTVRIRSSSWSVTFSFSHGVLGIKSMSECAGIRSISISGNTVSGGYSGYSQDCSMTVVGY